MTVETTENKVIYTADGATADFSFDFKTYNEDDIDVYVDYQQDTDVSVSLNTDQNNNPGGVVSMNNIPQAGAVVTILREVEPTQGTSYPVGGRFPSKSHEGALDRLTMMVQQALEVIGRAIRLPYGDTNNPNLPPPEQRANTFIGFDAQGYLTVAPSTNDPNSVQKPIADVSNGELMAFDNLKNAQPTGESVASLQQYADDAVAAGIATRLPLAGGTITGDLTVEGSTIVQSPVANDNPATKGYVDTMGGATWQDMTSQRALDTDYVNDTGQALFINIRGQGTPYVHLIATVDGLQMYFGTNSSSTLTDTGGMFGPIPPGSTYRVNVEQQGGAGTLIDWHEFRP